MKAHCKHGVPLEKHCPRCLDESMPPLEKLLRNQAAKVVEGATGESRAIRDGWNDCRAKLGLGGE